MGNSKSKESYYAALDIEPEDIPYYMNLNIDLIIAINKTHFSNSIHYVQPNVTHFDEYTIGELEHISEHYMSHGYSFCMIPQQNVINCEYIAMFQRGPHNLTQQITSRGEYLKVWNNCIVIFLSAYLHFSF